MKSIERFFRFIWTLLFLKKIFTSHFHVVAGNAAKTAAAKLRHKVFCKEKGWESTRENGLEQDTYDVHSIPIVLYLRNVVDPIACIRLILAKDYHQLPVEKNLVPLEGAEILVETGLVHERERSAEVSRLAVDRDFRKRSSEKGRVFVEGSIDPLNGRFPFIAVGIYLAMIRSASLQNIDHIYFMVEPALFRSLRKLGASPQAVGKKVEHRGERIPCYICVSEMIKNLPWWSRPVWRAICDQIDKDIKKAGTPMRSFEHSTI